MDRRDLSRRHHLLHPYAQHAGFTGTYKGKRLSVQGTGIGQPSLAIYVHELLTAYGARTLLRVGSCGALAAKVALRDLVIAMSACTDSSMNRLRFEGIDYAPTADFDLLRACVDEAERAGLPYHVGPVAAWDSFYSDRPELLRRLGEYGVLAVEMETAALYTLAAKHGARALTLCTTSDSLVTGEETLSRRAGAHVLHDGRARAGHGVALIRRLASSPWRGCGSAR